MHRIDGDGNVAGQFTDGGPGQPATLITSTWLNAVQEEIANAIEGLGGTLSKPSNTQLRDRLLATFAASRTRHIVVTMESLWPPGSDSTDKTWDPGATSDLPRFELNANTSGVEAYGRIALPVGATLTGVSARIRANVSTTGVKVNIVRWTWNGSDYTPTSLTDGVTLSAAAGTNAHVAVGLAVGQTPAPEDSYTMIGIILPTGDRKMGEVRITYTLPLLDVGT